MRGGGERERGGGGWRERIKERGVMEREGEMER